MLGRGTEWRQGAILTAKSSYLLRLFEENAENCRAIVISHDCDIPNDKEEYIELLIGKEVQKADSNFTAAKNIRRLHLRYCNPVKGSEHVIELGHSDRRFIKKMDFDDFADLNKNFYLSYQEKYIFKQWLAARYARPAFPDEFQTRLSKKKNFEKKTCEDFKPLKPVYHRYFF